MAATASHVSRFQLPLVLLKMKNHYSSSPSNSLLFLTTAMDAEGANALIATG